jgi:hypothetical protein
VNKENFTIEEDKTAKQIEELHSRIKEAVETMRGF